MARYSLAEFVAATAQRERREGVFELAGPHLLEVNLDGRVWTKTGTMVAYTGDVRFTREGVLEHGGESVQMEFRGEGFVVVQPYEEGVFQGA